MIKKFFVLGICILFLINFVFALGITPGRTTIDFEPNLKQEIAFSVINSEHKDMAVIFDVRGDLNQSISLNKAFEEFSASEETKSFSYSVDLPSEIETPGLHTAEIVAIEMPKDLKSAGTVIGSRLAVISQLYVHVPYPGKYLELDPQIINAQEDGNVLFLIAAVNRGDLDIGNAKATIDVYDSFGEKVAIVESEQREILSGQRIELIAKWSATKINAGDYRVYISVTYDGEFVDAEKNFKIGKNVLEIQRIEVNDFELGGIAKFNALVENKWSEKITDAYLNLIVYNEKDQTMADIKSQVYEVDSLSKTNMIAYWDTVGVKKGNYDGKLFLKHNKGSFDRDVTVRVSNDEILVMGLSGEVLIEKLKKSNLQMILIIAVIVLGTLNLLWFIVLRKFIMKRKR
jgi:hypothetical protein